MLKRSIIYPALLLSALFILSRPLQAQILTAGGEVSYKFLYRSGGEFPKNHYMLTVKLYKECSGDGALPLSVNVKIALANPPGVSPSYYPGIDLARITQSRFYITKQDHNECSQQAPVCYYVGVYEQQIALDLNSGDWVIYVQDDARKSADFVNVSTDGIGKLSGGVMGFTYSCRVPAGLFTNITTMPNSPVVKKEYPLILCAGKPFSYDFSANDPDGDSLSYQFVPSHQGYIWVAPRHPGTASSPPFLSLFYNPGFTGSTPLGNNALINPVTGMISGTGPVMPGKYIVSVEITKHRNGEVVTRHRKEIQFLFNNCTWPRAQLDSTYQNCKGTTISFTNYSTGQIGTYSWDFGDPSTNADTSNLAQPTWHYAAPGVYTVRLLLNKGTNLCKDSAFATAIVDSGLNASFDFRRSLDVCNVALYDFTNTSTEGANPITSYAWDFGEQSTSTDISSQPNPSYLYPRDGAKNVRLIIRNDIGCADTAFRALYAFASVLQAPNDTTICILDTIALTTNTNGYPGVFNWSPNYRISSLTDPAPLVNPQRDTLYFVTFTDTTGCVTTDSVLVKVRDTINISIDNIDTTICRLDTILLSATHDGNTVTWQPSGTTQLVNPDGSSVNAFPYSTGNMVATVHFGSCNSSDSIFVKVVPRPQVTVSNDTVVCLGAPVPLHASGGSFYLWSPASTLDNPVIPDPIARPVRNTIYSVSVYDTLGCPKHTIGNITVTTFRSLIAVAGKDTLVVFGEPVQLNASGGQYYQWSPSIYLSDPDIPNPVARPMEDIVYTLTVSNDDNCADSTKVTLRAFKDPDMYVPTAFTPNNDGLNDKFRVVPVGFQLKELRIYDRWGQLIHSSSTWQKGWDGKSQGVLVPSGTYVWIATGTNFKTGAAVMKKGHITLIR
jgi:gliding motility-associated-like protein